MWISFHGYATEQTQLREGEGISEFEDNIKVEEKREIKGRKIFEEIKAKNFSK